MNKKLISFVIPVLNEEDNIVRLYQSLTPVMNSLASEYEFELIFTDNHSQDASFSILKKLKATDDRIRIIRFSRNFGYQRSLLTGYKYAKGNSAIQLDCDLQDSPTLIHAFIKKWEEGYKVVYGIRLTRKEGKLISWLRKFFYKIINVLSDYDLPKNAGDFRLVDRCVLDHLAQIRDMQPYLRGEIAKIGFKQIGIPYHRDERKFGKSKFSYRHLFRLAIDGIVSNSVIPLRFATYFSLFVSVLTLSGLIFFFVGKFFFGKGWPAGFATTTLLLLISLALNACFLGIIGEYLARIYTQVNPRPIAIIEEELH